MFFLNNHVVVCLGPMIQKESMQSCQKDCRAALPYCQVPTTACQTQTVHKKSQKRYEIDESKS